MDLFQNVLANRAGGLDRWDYVDPSKRYRKINDNWLNNPPIVFTGGADDISEYADIMSRYRPRPDNPSNYSAGSYHSEFEDLEEKDHGASWHMDGDNLYSYLQQSPIVQRHWGNEIDPFGQWTLDPDILQELDWRMQDLGGLTPINVLLGDMGHDAVVPWLPGNRGSASGSREVSQGSVLCHRQKMVGGRITTRWRVGNLSHYQ